MPVPRCSNSLMTGPVSVSRAWAARRSQRSPSSNSPVQMRVPARFTSAGEMTGSAPQPCCSARAIASRHRRRVVAKGSIFDAKASSARQATSRYGRPILRARSAPSCRCRSTVLVSQRPRFDDSEIHERHRAQVAVERDVLVRLAGYRRGQEPDLLDDPREVAALPRERQSQRCDRHVEAVLAVWRRRSRSRLRPRSGGRQPRPGVPGQGRWLPARAGDPGPR